MDGQQDDPVRQVVELWDDDTISDFNHALEIIRLRHTERVHAAMESIRAREVADE